MKPQRLVESGFLAIVFGVLSILLAFYLLACNTATAAPELTCTWINCLNQGGQQVGCFKINSGPFGTEFVQYAKKEAGGAGQVVMLECVKQNEEPLVVTSALMGMKVGK